MDVEILRPQTARPQDDGIVVATMPWAARTRRRKSARVALEFDDEFADIVAAEEHVDGFGSSFETFDDGLPVFEFAGHFPHAELFPRLHEF